MAVGVMASSLGGITADGVTLAQALVDAGAVTAEAMAAAGFFAPTATPTTAPAVLEATASTDNLIQIKVVYSQAVDKDTAEDVDNYDVGADISNAALQDDGVTVVLTLEDNKNQQDKVDVVINDVKDTAGTVIATDYTIKDVEFLDMTIPTALDASVVGNDTFKVIFSEPMEPDDVDEEDVAYLNKTDFVVKSTKTLYVKSVRLQNNNTEALVEMYAKLTEGEVTLQVKSGSHDYAGFGVVGTTFTLNVVKDEEKPVVIGYEKASRDKVTLIWSEDIEFNGAVEEADYYHTNSSNSVEEDGVTIDGNKMTLEFDDDHLLPEGTAYVYVLKESVNDLWDNKNDQQMIQVEIVADDTAPEVKETDVSYDEDLAQYKLKITFTEDVNGELAIDEDNYTILDADGDEIDNAIDYIEPADEDDVTDNVTLFFEDTDMGGEYAVVIKDVEDKAGNEIVEVTVPFTVGDEIDPDPSEFEATLYNGGEEGQMVKVSFYDVMATEGKYSVTDVEKYVLFEIEYDEVEDEIVYVEETALEDIDNVEIAISEDGKAVEITIPSEADDEDDGKDLDDAIYALVISRVADAAGNKMDGLSTGLILIEESADVVIESAEATAIDTIKVKFSDELVKFDVDDIRFRYTVGEAVYFLEIGSVDVGLDGGKTVATYTLGDELDYTAEFEGYTVTAVAADADDDVDSENQYGDSLSFVGNFMDVDDKIGPKVAEVDDEPAIAFTNGAVNSKITITFTEDLNADVDLEKLYAQDLIVKKADGTTLKAGVDYTTEVNGADLEITVKNVTDLDNFSVQSKDTISYIQDVEENAAVKFGRVRN